MANSDDEARNLYQAGVTYVVQQETLASLAVCKVWLCVSVALFFGSACLCMSLLLGVVPMCLCVPESMYMSGMCLGLCLDARMLVELISGSFTGESVLVSLPIIFVFLPPSLPSPDLRTSSAHSLFTLMTFDWDKHAPPKTLGYTSSSTILH